MVVGKSAEHTIGVVNVLAGMREMVAVIHVLELEVHLVRCAAVDLGHALQVGGKDRLQLMVGDATDGRKARIERHILQVVDGREDA